jgi:hypothetical protein
VKQSPSTRDVLSEAQRILRDARRELAALRGSQEDASRQIAAATRSIQRSLATLARVDRAGTKGRNRPPSNGNNC